MVMDAKELMAMIQDTLYQNDQWPQFPIEDAYNQWLDTGRPDGPSIEFTYNEIDYIMMLKEK